MATIRIDRRRIPDEAGFASWRAPDGWPMRRFDWPAAGSTGQSGRLLFLGGRGDIPEKYLETFAHWRDKGWAITSLDWRGQGGSGRLSSDPHVGHVDDFDRYIADFAAFWADWSSQAAGARVLVGHSMGGHLALRAMVEAVARPDAAVLVAPMLGLHSPIGARGGEALARSMARWRGPATAAWKANEIPAARATRQALLTHDADRYADELWWHDHDPALRLGPPSWGWVARAFTSSRRLATDTRLAALDIPVLMLVADRDRLVRTAAAVAIAARLPDARLVRFGDESAHEILREADPVRDRALAEIDSFLADSVAAR